MAEDSSRPTGIGDVLDRVLRRLDRDHRLAAYRVWSFWSEEVGEAIAARAQPAAYRGGILSVRVSGHTWMQELQFMKHTIRKRLNARLGRELIRDIYFVSASATAPPRTVESPPDTAETGTEMPPLPAVRDPRLAEIYERIVRAQAARRNARR